MTTNYEHTHHVAKECPHAYEALEFIRDLDFAIDALNESHPFCCDDFERHFRRALSAKIMTISKKFLKGTGSSV